MAALSAPGGAQASTTAAPARTWRHTLSQRLARLSGKEIGDACKCDHSTASRIASGQRGATVEEWCALIDLMGLKLVDQAKLCVRAEEFDFMRRMTARALANEQTARELTFDDPE